MRAFGAARARRGFAGAWPQLDLFGLRVAAPTSVVLSAPAPAPGGRWEFTRPWLVSPHLARARRELEGVRSHFPELDGLTIRVGLTKRRGVLGLAAMAEVPMIWIRPRRIRRFAIAHELTHLLQARGLVPGGEKSADLHALARSAAYVDVVPFYLKVPARLCTPEPDDGLLPGVARALHTLAREALEGRKLRPAIRFFESRAAGLPSPVPVET